MLLALIARINTRILNSIKCWVHILYCAFQINYISLTLTSNILNHVGPLSSVCNLSYYFINSSTVNISWSAPFTLPGTYITGYNISVTSINGTSSDLFTLNNYYLLYLMEIRNCYVMNIAVSGFNGQNGETEVLTVSSTGNIFEPIVLQ